MLRSVPSGDEKTYGGLPFSQGKEEAPENEAKAAQEERVSTVIRAKIVGKLAQRSPFPAPLSLSLSTLRIIEKKKRKEKEEEEEEAMIARRGREISREEDGRIGGRMGKRAAGGSYQMGRWVERGD